MFKLIYRRQSALWDRTDNPIIANHWYEQGENVEVIDNDKIINVWLQEGEK